MTDMKPVAASLQELVDKLGKDGQEDPADIIDRLPSLLGQIPPLDPENNPEHKAVQPQLEQCGVSLWNHAVTKKTAGKLTPQLNAKLRHVANNLVFLCHPSSEDEATVKKQLMMALKTTRAWLDANDPAMAANPVSMAEQCIGKLRTLVDQQADGQSEDTSANSTVLQKLEADKELFKLLCYKAEAACSLNEQEVGVAQIQKAKELLSKVPQQTLYLSMLCYNLGVECFHRQQHEHSATWLRESFELGKLEKSPMSAKNQARTLRLLANAYLEWDSRLHHQKALNAIGLANAEHSHPAGLYLKMRVLLQGDHTADDRVQAALDDILKHADLTADLGLNTVQLIFEHNRHSVAFEGMQRLLEHYKHSPPDYSKMAAAQLELLLRANRMQQAKELVEQCITGNHVGQPLNADAKKRFHLLIWEQAGLAFEAKECEESLQWYNYSLSLYSSQEHDDPNLAKLHRNRASCCLALHQGDKAEEYVTQAEKCDASSPYTYYVKFKVALLQSDEVAAMESLSRMSECATKTGSDEDVHTLICLAAQLAFEQGNKELSMQALENLVKHSPEALQVLTALRCLTRLKLTLLQHEQGDRIKELQLVIGYVRTALDKLVGLKGGGGSGDSNAAQNETTWFMKISWNLALQCDDACGQMVELFVLCHKLSGLCLENMACLVRQKTCLLMAAAAGLQVAKQANDHLDKRQALVQVVDHVEECRQIMGRIEHIQLSDTEMKSKDATTPVLLVLYEFEARAHLDDPKVEQVMERALLLPCAEPKAFETLAALAMEKPLKNKALSTRALKIAIKKHLHLDRVDFAKCSQAFHSLIQLALQGGSNSDPGSREEAWGYYMDVVDIIENRAKGDYPEMEVVWLMTKAWNSGVHLYSAGKYADAMHWCELGMRLLGQLSTLKDNYSTQMTSVYSEILAKVDKNA